MKKKSLKSLSLKKAKVSNLNQQGLTGGTDLSIFFCTFPFPVPQRTKGGCSELVDCDSDVACTANVCKTIEFDTETRPIC
ncbi:MAG: hypothetical protein AAF611_06450 [Bacteroidota bacterium]